MLELTPHLHPGTSNKELDSLITFEPRTKEDFQKFSRLIIEYIVKRQENKPLYASFVEHHARELAAPLKDVEVRKVASGLTTLANEKQKEQRDKASGKKKTKAAAKPTLGSAKALTKWVTLYKSLNCLLMIAHRYDTTVYNEALDDEDPNFFM